MTAVLHTEGLTKHYGKIRALTNASLTIPSGQVVGLVGPNGAGKSTLLNLATGLIAPTSGTIEVLGNQPAASATQLARVGFVAQDTPVYANLSISDHLRMGAHMNPRWDNELAHQRVKQVGLRPDQKAGRLSGGQRAQLALTMAAAKRPELMILDEPVASLDPLARRTFLQNLMEFVAELDVSVILSSHLLSDVERICDYLIVLTDSKVQLSGEVEDLVAVHYRLIGAIGDFDNLPDGVVVIQAEHTERQSTLIVQDTTGGLTRLFPDAKPLGLEDMVLSYLTRAALAELDGLPANSMEAQR